MEAIRQPVEAGAGIQLEIGSPRGRPNASSSRDQYAMELPESTHTENPAHPDFQAIFDPSLKPDDAVIGTSEFRVRVAF